MYDKVSPIRSIRHARFISWCRVSAVSLSTDENGKRTKKKKKSKLNYTKCRRARESENGGVPSFFCPILYYWSNFFFFFFVVFLLVVKKRFLSDVPVSYISIYRRENATVVQNKVTYVRRARKEAKKRAPSFFPPPARQSHFYLKTRLKTLNDVCIM